MTATLILIAAMCGQTVNVYGGQNTFNMTPPARSPQAELGHRFVDLEGKPIVDSPSPRSKQSREELDERAVREREETLRHRQALAERHRESRAWNAGYEDQFDRAWTAAWRNLPACNPDLDASVIWQQHKGIAPYWPACAPGWDRAFPPVPPSNGSYVFAPTSYGSSGQANPGGPG